MTITSTKIPGELGLTAVLAIVADSRVGAVTRTLQDLLEGAGTASASWAWEPMNRAAAITQFPNAWEAPKWNMDDPTDLERMLWVRHHLSPALELGFQHLAAISEQRATGTELSALVGFETPGGWKSALSHAAAYSRRASREPVWDAENVNGAFHYWMPSRVLALWNAAAA